MLSDDGLQPLDGRLRCGRDHLAHAELGLLADLLLEATLTTPARRDDTRSVSGRESESLLATKDATHIAAAAGSLLWRRRRRRVTSTALAMAFSEIQL